MKRQVSWGLLAGGTAVATAVPAVAATSGRETIKGTIVASGGVGTRTVITSVIIFTGTFTGAGRIVEVDNLPGDPDNVTRDDLVFAGGSMHIVSANQDFSLSVNPRSCVVTATIHRANNITGGTGKFTAATGHCTGTVTGRGVLPRNPDGSCDLSRDPLHEVDMITATGTLSFNDARRDAGHGGYGIRRWWTPSAAHRKFLTGS